MARVRCPECGKVCDSKDGFCPKCGREFKEKDKMAGGFPGMAGIPEPTVIPDDLDVQQLMAKGFELIASDAYTEAAEYWTKAVKDGYAPDDETYGRMVSSVGDCMLRISNGADVAFRKGAADLSLVLEDRDFSSDLLAEYASRVPQCSGQVMLVNLSTNYVVLMVESFNVYTDLRDLQQMCLNAQLFLKDVLEREEQLKDDGSLDPPQALKYIGTNVDFVDSLVDQITNAVNRHSLEDLEQLSDYWSEQTVLPYTQDLLMALQFSIQLRVTGRFSSKMFAKTRDSEIQNFLVKYIAGLKN